MATAVNYGQRDEISLGIDAGSGSQSQQTYRYARMIASPIKANADDQLI